MQGYDVIGDIHGHADALCRLLEKLGYRKSSGVYRHPNRKVIYNGVVSMPALGYYSASKHALEGLTEALSQEVAPLGIKVLSIQPGGFRTGIVERLSQV